MIENTGGYTYNILGSLDMKNGYLDIVAFGIELFILESCQVHQIKIYQQNNIAFQFQNIF